jgi:hypothetical protein
MSKPLREFHLFPQLPIELRLKIWPLAFHEPRVLEIRTADFPGNIRYISIAASRKVSDIRWVTKTPPPAALSICREARKEALKVYTLRIRLLASGGEVIYINPELDVVYANFKWEVLLQLFQDDVKAFDDEGSGVRSLALTSYMFFYGNFKGYKLDRLIYVDEEEDQEPFWADWDGDCTLVTPSPGRVETLRRREVGDVLRHDPDYPIEYLAIRRGDAARATITLQRFLLDQSLYLPLAFPPLE